MDINNYIYIWINKIELLNDNNIFVLDGLAFDGGFGFGNENQRSYIGELVLISMDEKLVIDTEIETIHLARKGFKWSIKADNVPKLPFLITNDKLIECIFNNFINFKFTNEAKNIFSRDGIGTQYPIISNDILGIITLEENNRINFLCYSKSKDKVFNKDHLVRFSEWELEAGTIFM